MKILEIISKKNENKLDEYASGGSTGAGSIASVANGLGGPMMPVIKRMAPGQSFFAPQFTQEPEQKKRKKRAKRQ